MRYKVRCYAEVEPTNGHQKPYQTSPGATSRAKQVQVRRSWRLACRLHWPGHETNETTVAPQAGSLFPFSARSRCSRSPLPAAVKAVAARRWSASLTRINLVRSRLSSQVRRQLCSHCVCDRTSAIVNQVGGGKRGGGPVCVRERERKLGGVHPPRCLRMQ